MKSNENQPEPIPYSMFNGQELLETLRGFTPHHNIHYNHGAVRQWGMACAALRNILNGVASCFVILFQGEKVKLCWGNDPLFEEKSNWPKAIFLLHIQNNKQMRTHFDWLPDAVTREVKADRGHADCPRKQAWEMPIQWVLVFFICLF